jgi:hypothetical protein
MLPPATYSMTNRKCVLQAHQRQSAQLSIYMIL